MVNDVTNELDPASFELPIRLHLLLFAQARELTVGSDAAILDVRCTNLDAVPDKLP